MAQKNRATPEQQVKVNKMLYEEKVPYLLTILFVALGWTISQVSTDLEKSPIIEYKTCRKVGTKGTIYTYTITNISSQKLFKKLKFVLRPKKSVGVKCLGEPEMNPQAPLELKDPEKDPNRRIRHEVPKYIGNSAVYFVPQLQPGTSIQLVMKTDKKAEIDITLWCDKPVRFLASSLQTLIVKKRFGFLMGTIVIWFILIFIYFVLLHKQKIKGKCNRGEECDI
jgi:hypothetical protein